MADRPSRASGALSPPRPGAGRIPAVDAARGAAILAMISYHFAWDLGAFGLAEIDAIGNPWWRLYARSIASAFLILVGISLVLATRGGFRPARYLRRLAVIVAAALAISAGTWFFDRGTFVFFGILHAIAAASVLGLAFIRLPPPASLAAALAAFAAPALFASPAFNTPFLWWIGLSTEWAPSVDFVPVLPWFGMTLLGIAAAQWAIAAGLDARLAAWRGDGPVGRMLRFAGRWSLLIYLVHQPVLIGILLGIARLSG